jgi:phenylalanyl-tRNA synthetase beta chain
MVKECYKMPVVELNFARLQKLVSKTNKKEIISTLPFLGLDIESETNSDIRIEYSPNRPDYSTDIGISLGLQGLLGIKKGMVYLDIKKSDNYKISVDSSVSQVRPFVTGVIAKNGKIDDKLLQQLIDMQEDLHFGIGRRRKKSSIGIHDLDKIEFPLLYTITNKNYKFVPLSSTKKQSVSEILEKTDVGKDYGHILGNSSKIPIIIDAKENTVSFPPIINSAMTTVTTKTKNLFVEVTGINKIDAEDMLSVVATILQSAGFELYSTKISGAKNSTPSFKTNTITFDPELINKILGTNLSSSTIVTSLKKCRLDATIKHKKISCTIPRYRFDIFGPMDIVEEVALGYGINKLEPILSPSQTLGQKNNDFEKLNSLSQLMVGLGYMEALNSSLTSKRVLYELTNRNATNVISVLDSKSQEHTILRDAILPSLIENLSNNIHEEYPQKLFEIGTVFSKGNPITEKINFGCVSAHKDANFSEIKSILQTALKISFNVNCKTKTSSHPMFTNGKVAEILANNKSFGFIGEIKNTHDNYKIRVPVVGFEINLSNWVNI